METRIKKLIDTGSNLIFSLPVLYPEDVEVLSGIVKKVEDLRQRCPKAWEHVGFGTKWQYRKIKHTCHKKRLRH